MLCCISASVLCTCWAFPSNSAISAPPFVPCGSLSSTRSINAYVLIELEYAFFANSCAFSSSSSSEREDQSGSLYKGYPPLQRTSILIRCSEQCNTYRKSLHKWTAPL